MPTCQRIHLKEITYLTSYFVNGSAYIRLMSHRKESKAGLIYACYVAWNSGSMILVQQGYHQTVQQPHFTMELKAN
jgi:hypothetical protein